MGWAIDRSLRLSQSTVKVMGQRQAVGMGGENAIRCCRLHKRIAPVIAAYQLRHFTSRGINSAAFS